jgi:stage V sporulation protein G
MTNGQEIRVERLYRFDGDGRLKAFADVSFGGSFVIKGLRVVQGDKGLFVGMPCEQGKDGKWYNVAYPITKEMRQELTEAVLTAYNE